MMRSPEDQTIVNLIESQTRYQFENLESRILELQGEVAQLQEIVAEQASDIHMLTALD